MRASILVFTAAALLIASPLAFAAPTCQDRNGDTIRCGTAGAMPVGWTLSPQERLERQKSRPPIYPSTNELLEMVCVIGVLFALIALMPEFDGSRSRDWGEQEEDHKKGR